MFISKESYKDLKASKKVRLFIKSLINQQVEHYGLLKLNSGFTIKDYLHSTWLNLIGYYFNDLKYDLNYWRYLDERYNFLLIG